MSSAYTLIPVLRTPTVDPGDKAVIDLYISGTGGLEKNKLVMNWANEELTADDPGKIKLGFEVAEAEEGGIGIGFVEDRELPESNVFSIDQAGATVSLPDWVCAPVEERTPGMSHTVYDGQGFDTAAPDSYKQIASETRGRHPPIRIEINIDEGAQPGDYPITFAFFYNSGIMEKPYFDRRELQLHVNNRRERWEPVPTYIAVAGGTAAVLSLISQSGFFTWASGYVPLL